MPSPGQVTLPMVHMGISVPCVPPLDMAVVQSLGLQPVSLGSKLVTDTQWGDLGHFFNFFVS